MADWPPVEVAPMPKREALWMVGTRVLVEILGLVVLAILVTQIVPLLPALLRYAVNP